VRNKMKHGGDWRGYDLKKIMSEANIFSEEGSRFPASRQNKISTAQFDIVLSLVIVLGMQSIFAQSISIISLLIIIFSGRGLMCVE